MKRIHNKQIFALAIFLIIILILIFSNSPVIASESIIIDDNLKIKNVSKYIEYFEDKEKRFTINDIQKKTQGWKRIAKDSVNFGFTESRYWFRFIVTSNMKENKEWLLEVDRGILSNVDLFIPSDKGSYHVKRNGTNINSKEKDILDRTIIFPIDSFSGEKTYYLGVFTYGPLIFNLNIMSPRGYQSETDEASSVYWFFYGLTITLILYNLLLLISIRERSYLYFTLFLISFLFWNLTNNGFTVKYLWPDAGMLHRVFLVIFINMLFFWLTLYVLTSIDAKKKFPIIYWLGMYFLGIPLLLYAAISPLINQNISIKITFALQFYSIAFYFVAGFYLAFFKKSRQARILLLAFVPAIIALPVYLLTLMTILPLMLITKWSAVFGLSISLIMLSYGLADKINIMKNELSDLNKNLEQKVEDRTTELQKANEKLKEMDKLKSNFFANISHEIRTPLTLILSPVESVIQGDYGEKIDEKFFLNLQKNAIRLLRLINNILDFSKLEAGRMELKVKEVDIVKMMKAFISAVLSAAESLGIALNFISLNESVRIFLDIEKAEKIAMNLFSNALKFTKKGGKIDIRIKDDDKNCYIEIEDSGEGIPEDKLASIFDRFSQADSSPTRKYEGTGIGLSLVKELIEMIGGSIAVKSRHIEKYPDNHGSIFTLTIPKGKGHLENRMDVIFITDRELSESIADADSRKYTAYSGMSDMKEADAIDEPEACDDKYSKYTILIVEDNIEMRNFIKFLLKEEYNICTAANGEEGLKMSVEIKPDLIISDVMMPIMNGYEMTKRIKEDEELKRIPVLLLTAKAEISEKIEGLEYGADDYLTKPFNSKELLTRAKGLLKVKKLQDDLFEINAHLEERIAQAISDIAQREHEALELIGSAAEFRDPETGSHIIRVSEYSRLLIKALGKDEETQDLLYYASPLHDIGKIGIPDAILLKPGKLDHDEFEIIKTHCEIGNRILRGKKSKFIQAGAIIAMTHHEKFDGSGYPNSLKGQDIPLFGRVIAVVDVFDALTSKRPYKDPMTFDDAVEIIKEERGRHFDPEIVELFIEHIDEIKKIYMSTKFLEKW